MNTAKLAIVIPVFQFSTGTLLSKLTHATGHNSRLDRTGAAGRRIAAFGSAEVLYSREELIAEMNSAFLCTEAEIESTRDNSAAYLKGWLEALKDNVRMIVTAAGAAQPNTRGGKICQATKMM